MITGRDKAKKEPEILRTPGAADRLNKFYARFDDKDFSAEQTTIRNDLLSRIHDQPPIHISNDEVITSINKLNVNKASGPDKVSAFVLKKCLSSLLWIIQRLFQISASNRIMPSPWKLG